MKTKTPKQFRKSKLLFIFSLVFLAMACSKNEEDGAEVAMENPPIALECDYFLEETRVLVDDPNAPVDYVIDCIARIKSDVIIEPGVVIAFDTDAGMKIEEDGSMVAMGTVDAPILFTGLVNERGSWAGISFLSPSVKNELAYVTIEYGGGKKIHANVDKANLTVSYDTRLDMNHCILRHSDLYGIYVRYTQELNIQNSVFTKNVIPVYSYITPQQMTVWNASNDYSGNDEDRVYLTGHANSLISNTKWQKINVPYVLSGNLGTAGDATTLTIEPGVHVYVAQGVEIETGDQTTFEFVGTQQEPIIFEGVAPSPGSWDGFRLHNSINSIMEHMIISHAAGTNQTFAHEAAIGIKYGTSVVLNEIDFRNLYGCAVKIVHDNEVEMSNLTKSNTNTGNVDTEDCVY